MFSAGYRQGRDLADKAPDAESAVWGRFPESAGKGPHLSGATYEPRSAWLFSTRNRRVMSCSLARCVCDLFARNCPQGWRLSGESRLIFVTAYPCRSMIPQGMRKRYRNNPAELVWGNPCLLGERETAPSLGVRLVSVGRKREANNGAAKPDGRNVRESDYG